MNDYKLAKLYNWELAHEKVGTMYQKVSILPVSPGVGKVDLIITARKTLVDLGNVNSAVYNTVNFSVLNPGQQLMGDQIVVISQPNTTTTDITYDYNSTQFYLTRCGGPENTSRFDNGQQERDVTIFTYDGAVFCATYDNC